MDTSGNTAPPPSGAPDGSADAPGQDAAPAAQPSSSEAQPPPRVWKCELCGVELKGLAIDVHPTSKMHRKALGRLEASSRSAVGPTKKQKYMHARMLPQPSATSQPVGGQGREQPRLQSLPPAPPPPPRPRPLPDTSGGTSSRQPPPPSPHDAAGRVGNTSTSLTTNDNSKNAKSVLNEVCQYKSWEAQYEVDESQAAKKEQETGLFRITVTLRRPGLPLLVRTTDAVRGKSAAHAVAAEAVLRALQHEQQSSGEGMDALLIHAPADKLGPAQLRFVMKRARTHGQLLELCVAKQAYFDLACIACAWNMLYHVLRAEAAGRALNAERSRDAQRGSAAPRWVEPPADDELPQEWAEVLHAHESSEAVLSNPATWWLVGETRKLLELGTLPSWKSRGTSAQGAQPGAQAEPAYLPSAAPAESSAPRVGPTASAAEAESAEAERAVDDYYIDTAPSASASASTSASGSAHVPSYAAPLSRCGASSSESRQRADPRQELAARFGLREVAGIAHGMASCLNLPQHELNTERRRLLLEVFDGCARRAELALGRLSVPIAPHELSMVVPQELSMLLWAFAKASHASEPLFSAALPVAIAQVEAGVYNRQELASVLLSYARQAHPAPRLFEAAASWVVNERRAGRPTVVDGGGRDLNRQDLFNLIYAYTVAGEGRGVSAQLMDACEDSLQSLAHGEGSQRRHLPAFERRHLTQLQQWILWREVELRGPRTRLHPEVRAKCTASLASGDTLAPGGYTISRLQLNVGMALARLGYAYESEKQLPSGYSIDIALPAACVAIEVDGPHHFTQRGAPTGATLLKRRQLRALGWKVVSITHHEWYMLRGEGGSLRHAEERLVASKLRPVLG